MFCFAKNNLKSEQKITDDSQHSDALTFAPITNNTK